MREIDRTPVLGLWIHKLNLENIRTKRKGLGFSLISVNFFPLFYFYFTISIRNGIGIVNKIQPEIFMGNIGLPGKFKFIYAHAKYSEPVCIL